MGLLWRVIKWMIFSLMFLGIFMGLDYISGTGKVWPLFPMLLAIGMIMILFKSTFDDSKPLMSVTAVLFLGTAAFLKYGFVFVEPYLLPYVDIFDVRKQLIFENFYYTWTVWHFMFGLPIVAYMMSKDD